jgi:hypothetical protein
MDPSDRAPQPDPQTDPLLRGFLADRDAACPVCRYNLRGLTSNHCPECGAHLDLRVGSADLNLGPWLASLLSVGLPLGFLFIMTGLFVVMSVTDGGVYREDLPILGCLVAGTAGYAIALAILIRKRLRFWRLSRGWQLRLTWLVSVCAWVSALAIIWAIFALDG